MELVDHGTLAMTRLYSHHLAYYQNAALTAEQMGHSNTNMLRNTYRNINTIDGKSITKKVAGKFWEITPEEKHED